MTASCLVHFTYLPDQPACWFGDTRSRDQLIRDLLKGQIENPTRVLLFDPDATGFGWTVDISCQIAREIVMRAMAEEIRLPQCIRAFVDKYYHGERRAA